MSEEEQGRSSRRRPSRSGGWRGRRLGTRAAPAPSGAVTGLAMLLLVFVFGLIAGGLVRVGGSELGLAGHQSLGSPASVSPLAGAGASPSSRPVGSLSGEESSSSSAASVSPVPAPFAPSGGSSEPASPIPSGSSSPSAVVAVPIVPVVDFRSALVSVSAADVRATLAGTSPRFKVLEIVRGEAEAVLTALGAISGSRRRLVLAADSAQLGRDLARRRDRLGFLRADSITPAVRALAWGRQTLFGVDRLTDLDHWPLTALLPAVTAPSAGDATWTLVAGGDIMLDRGVHRQTQIIGKGADFPFDGGTAMITGRRCCSSFGWVLPNARRTGHRGAVRALLKSADVTIANQEGPAPRHFTYHPHGTVFSFDQRLLTGLRRAGIDWVSLANNHIGDAGRAAVGQTTAALDRLGVRHGGAGATERDARRASIFTVNRVRVAILARDMIARYYAAGAGRPGSAQLHERTVVADIRAARRAGAGVVIVFPHWGVEYQAGPTRIQRKLAHAMIDAGADLIIGNHAHWAGAFEVYRGKPIWYALGNLVFDQSWSEPTMEGIILELTFRDRALVQIRLHPTILLDQAQPNFLDPARDGRVVLRRVFDASRGLLPW